MKYAIKVYDTYPYDTSSGIKWDHNVNRTLKYDSIEEAENAAKYICKDFDYKIVKLKEVIIVEYEEDESR